MTLIALFKKLKWEMNWVNKDPQIWIEHSKTGSYMCQFGVISGFQKRHHWMFIPFSYKISSQAKFLWTKTHMYKYMYTHICIIILISILVKHFCFLWETMLKFVVSVYRNLRLYNSMRRHLYVLKIKKLYFILLSSQIFYEF